MKKMSKLIVVGFLSTISGLAFAETGRSVFTPTKKAEGNAEQKPSIGLSAGLANPSESQNSTMNYSLEYGIQPVIPFSVGAKLSSFAAPGSGNNASLTRTSLLLTGDYNFGGDIAVIKNSYVGLEVGPVLDNIRNSATVDLGIAPRIGFDIPLGAVKKYSLGAVADYLFVGGAKTNVFSLNGIVKYWF